MPIDSHPALGHNDACSTHETRDHLGVARLLCVENDARPGHEGKELEQHEESRSVLVQEVCGIEGILPNGLNIVQPKEKEYVVINP